MTYKMKITMDNGQSKVILMNGRGSSEVIEQLIWEGDNCNLTNKFITVDAEDGNAFTYCVGKLSTIEILGCYRKGDEK